MSTTPFDPGSAPSGWQRRHLLGLEELTAEEITLILDKAETFRRAIEDGRRQSRCKIPLLEGKTCVNLFFENSTRTRNSFSVAARRLGADALDFSPATSSLSKGETFIDTAKNIEAMGIDLMIVRHPTPGAPHLLAQNLRCGVINAGDGAHEHPTQGLLDIMTIRQRKGRVAGLTVALVGDIAHSRTARSNIWGLRQLGANVIVCGPSTLVSPHWAELGVEYSYSLDEILPRVDVLNLLRIQFERQCTRPFPSVQEYAYLYAMNRARLAKAKPDVLILAPGPINRGVEVTAEVADGPQSAILQQVANGVAVRMAVIWLLLGGKGGESRVES
jgi:aspartate carbamoyltransferase catalytic subunit